ncbi:MAG: YlbF family regulator [Clostridiaceae bacterium]|nr:YlbF family regulator [Clostridiaceae bacterium]MDD6703014.1 YlbF family regulator [Clostridiaceae bacterium]MDY5933665.1 YlbF family regulator [Oscillospiraceae bacterium]
MDIIEITRQLGAAIQQDERYLAFHEARRTNEADTDLNDLINKIQLIHMSYQHEAAKDDANEEKLAAYDKEFSEVYQTVMANENMQKYEAARHAVDDMMNEITAILSLCVQGEDPKTCQPQEEHHCSGECGSCGGCH